MRHTVDIKSAPKLSFAALITTFLGGVFMLTGLAAPHWVINEFPAGGGVNVTTPQSFTIRPQPFTIGPQPMSSSSGLWQYCYVFPSGRVCYAYPFIYSPVLVEFLSVAALLFAGATGLFVLAYVVFPHLRNWKLATVTLIGSGITVLLDVVVLVLVAIGLDVGSSLGFNTSHMRLGWAWALSCTGAAHYVVVGIISLVFCLKRSQEEPTSSNQTKVAGLPV